MRHIWPISLSVTNFIFLVLFDKIRYAIGVFPGKIFQKRVNQRMDNRRGKCKIKADGERLCGY